MSSRDRRHRRIRELVDSGAIGSQDELASRLQELGLRCTQATLSRDLRDLHISRVNTPDGPRYRSDPAVHHAQVLRRVVGMEILGVRHNGQLIVVRTMEGRAEGVAAYLDRLEHPDIMGTIAGDDTVFVAPADIDTIEQLVRDIRDVRTDSGEPR